MSIFALLSKQIKESNSKESLSKCEAEITEAYESGKITVNQFSRLDVKVLERSAEI